MAVDATTVERASRGRRRTPREPAPLAAGGLCPGPWQALELPFDLPLDGSDTEDEPG